MNHDFPRNRHIARLLAGGCGILIIVGSVNADSELARRASWQPLSVIAARDQVLAWGQSLNLTSAQYDHLASLWSLDAGDSADTLRRTVESFAIVYPQVTPWLEPGFPSGSLPVDTSWLEQPDCPEFVRVNACLFIGKSYALRQMYDEALDTLMPLKTEQVIDPASLLFYQAAAHYRLRQKDQGIAVLRRLLENKEELPQRYTTVADLMLVDLASLKPESLDEVARIMDSIRVRLDLGRAGTRVRKEERDVIDKLDKMIDQLEQQRQKMLAQASGKANGKQPSMPANDSSLPQMQATGDVDARKLLEDAEWGDLPPKERQEALQVLSKDFPSHYREVIEEYFRKLATESPATE